MNTHTARRTRSRGRSTRRSFQRNRRSNQRSHRNTRSKRKLPTFDPSQFINKNPIEINEEMYEPEHTFADFDLDKKIVALLKEHNITIPSPIQDQALPAGIAGKDIIGLAETGTGKTAAFLLPLIQKTIKNNREQTLILTPTRELALQVEAEFRKFSESFRLFATVCVGGTNIRPQIKSLRRRNHFVIGTPGRILDLIDRGNIRPQNFTNVVLDEADRMLDMGFIHDMRKILSDVPRNRQTLLFSATMTKEAENLINDFMTDPIIVSVKKKDVTDSIRQDVLSFTTEQKFDLLLALLNKDKLTRVIIFGAMKHRVEKLAKDLKRAGIKAESIHGNKSHGQRQRSLNAFKSGNARVLVATDVAARGIHVDNVSHVLNYDLPGTFEDYVHRIGRTGRGDKKGMAITFIPAETA